MAAKLYPDALVERDQIFTVLGSSYWVERMEQGGGWRVSRWRLRSVVVEAVDFATAIAAAEADARKALRASRGLP